MSAEFFNRSEIARTRKPCLCKWCYEKIEVGNPASRISGKWEGDFWSGRFHPECASARSQWFRENPQEDYAPEESMQRGSTEARTPQ